MAEAGIRNRAMMVSRRHNMIKWMSKINTGKLVQVGLIYTVVATVVHQIEAMLTMNYYLDPAYAGLWSKLMMPTSLAGTPIAGPPPAAFFITSLILSFVIGISLGLIYYYVRDMLPARQWERVFFFTDLMIATSFLFSTLPMYLMLNVPVGLLVSWFVSSFVILLISAYSFVRLLK